MNLPNSDPSNMTPRMMDSSEISNEKPTIDKITRGTIAAGYLKELCEYYPHDKIAPGLQSAWLPDKLVYYVSIHRFPQQNITSRAVVAKATADTLEEAERQCMEIWRGLCRQVEQERRNAKG